MPACFAQDFDGLFAGGFQTVKLNRWSPRQPNRHVLRVRVERERIKHFSLFAIVSKPLISGRPATVREGPFITGLCRMQMSQLDPLSPLDPDHINGRFPATYGRPSAETRSS